MRILGLETSGERAGIAVLDGERTLGERSFLHDNQLSRDLIPEVRDLLKASGVLPAHLEGIAVSAGPGSFTGLRIGVTAAKTLAYALEIPVAPVGTFRALAEECAAPVETLVCTLLPAGEDQVLAALFQWTAGGLEPRAEEVQLPARDLAARLSHTPWPVVLAGDPGDHLPLLREALGERLRLPQGPRQPSAVTIARLGATLLERGEAVPVHDLAPRYLRPSTPEARRAAREPL